MSGNRSGFSDQPSAIVARNGQGPGPAFSTTAMSWPSPDGDIIVVRVAGEIDLLSLPRLQASLATVLAVQPHYLVVDLAGVTFCGVCGFTLLADTAHRAAADGIGYAVSGLSRHLNRYSALLWEPGHPVRYPTAAMAATAIRADQQAQPNRR